MDGPGMILPVFLFGVSACGGAQTAASLSQASAIEATSTQIHDAVAAIPDKTYASLIERTQAMSLVHYYQALVASTSEATLQIDGETLANRHAVIVSYADKYRQLATTYSTVGEYWQAINYDATVRPSAAQIAQALQGLKAPTPQSSASLGLVDDSCQDGIPASKLPQVGDDLSSTTASVVTPYYPEAVAAAATAKNGGILTYQGNRGAMLYAVPQLPDEGAVRSKTFLDAFNSLVASQPPHESPYHWTTLPNGVKVVKEPPSQYGEVRCRQWTPNSTGLPTFNVVYDENGVVTFSQTYEDL